MAEHFGEALKRRIIELGLNTENFIGCTAEEIEAVCAAQGVKRLPWIYREYLETMGQSGFGGIWYGSDFYYGQVLELKYWTHELLEDNRCLVGKAPELPDDAFVFLMHQGYEYQYFLTEDTGDDPPVYLGIEGNEARSWANSLSEYFLKEVERAGRSSMHLNRVKERKPKGHATPVKSQKPSNPLAVDKAIFAFLIKLGLHRP